MRIFDWAFSADRFWKSIVTPNCFFAGYLVAMILDRKYMGCGFAHWRVLQSLLLGLLYFSALEVAQVFIPGRTISGGDIFLHWIAYVVGMFMGGLTLFGVSFVPPSFRFAIKSISLWFFLLIYLSIYPLVLRDVKDVSFIERFSASFATAPRISDTIANLLLGIPVAWVLFDAWFRAGVKDRIILESIFRCVIIAATVFSLGLIVEALQHLFAQRFPSVFDIVFQVIGALLASLAFLFLRIERFPLIQVAFDYLARLSANQILLIVFVFGVLVFEWTPWIPSLEMSTIKDGLRELSLPFTSAGYPWDLHWQSDRIGVLLVFFCSALTGLAWHFLLQPIGSKNRIRWVLSLVMSFFGFGIEFGKIFISTKYATPMLLLASLLGGLVICVGLVIWHGMIANQKSVSGSTVGGERDV